MEIAETVIYPSFLFRVHDRVMCEATYNATMPFKWNATKVQVLPGGGGGAGLMASQVSYLSEVPIVPGTGLVPIPVPYHFRTLSLASQHFFRATVQG